MAFSTLPARIRNNPIVRATLFGIGAVLLIVAPLVSPLPGPGGLLCFAAGLGLILQNSYWARKRYVLFKKQRPRMGGWADWGLRRKSPRRRLARDRARNPDAAPPAINPVKEFWRWLRANSRIDPPAPGAS